MSSGGTPTSADSRRATAPRRWRRRLVRGAVGYLAIGFALSFVLNLRGVWAGEPTAFVWTGSVAGNLTLFFWWFLVPALLWPWYLFYLLIHRSGR
jgi:hypothetical protein